MQTRAALDQWQCNLNVDSTLRRSTLPSTKWLVCSTGVSWPSVLTLTCQEGMSSIVHHASSTTPFSFSHLFLDSHP